MKAFWAYTGLRIALFVGCFVVIFGVWYLVAGHVDLFLTVLLAAVISAVLSWRLLAVPRQGFASAVDERAHRAAAKFEEMKAKEDVD